MKRLKKLRKKSSKHKDEDDRSSALFPQESSANLSPSSSVGSVSSDLTASNESLKRKVPTRKKPSWPFGRRSKKKSEKELKKCLEAIDEVPDVVSGAPHSIVEDWKRKHSDKSRSEPSLHLRSGIRAGVLPEPYTPSPGGSYGSLRSVGSSIDSKLERPVRAVEHAWDKFWLTVGKVGPHPVAPEGYVTGDIYSNPCILRLPLQPDKYGLKLEVVLK